MFTLFTCSSVGNPKNCVYNKKIEVTDTETLTLATSHDYVCAEYKNNYRSIDNFKNSNCIAMDCDNTHSEESSEWVTPVDVKNSFPDVAFAVHYSRNNNKEKDGKPPRPKFHVLFPIATVTDAEEYSTMKQALSSKFPYFDDNALDAGRFFYGTVSPEVEIIEGSMYIDAYLTAMASVSTPVKTSSKIKKHNDKIFQGERNSKMYKRACDGLDTFGESKIAERYFRHEAEKCEPKLEEKELNLIWKSAVKHYREKIKNDSTYMVPYPKKSREPKYYTEVDQSKMMAETFRKRLRYSPQTSFLFYNGSYWEESDCRAQSLAQKLTSIQLEEAEFKIKEATKAINKCMRFNAIQSGPYMDSQLNKYKKSLDNAEEYKKYVLSCRQSNKIMNVLTQVKPMITFEYSDLDSDPFKLCTPNGTIDLKTGVCLEHNPEDLITKMTSVSPGDSGKELWDNFLHQIFCDDEELIKYVQLICGLAAIGKVYVEAMIIAYGSGSNGKSTFFNTIARVFDTYAGCLSADALSVNCKRNIKPELAEVRGKRLLIAAELYEGAVLSDSMVKQLCSTDEIYAEKKYKAPFKFVPCHTLVLYTNNLPKVRATDDGVWRRLIIIPFNAKITGESDIKNYSDYLFENAGEYILSWILCGAKEVIENEYKVTPPEIVANAINRYRNNNDWFGKFIDECCEPDPEAKVSSSELYSTYRNYCNVFHEYTKSTTDFYGALEAAGYRKKIIKNRKYIEGLKFKEDHNEEEGQESLL